MRKRFSISGLLGLETLLAFSFLAIAPSAMAQGKAAAPGTKDSLYNGNSLKPNPDPGGPAPARDIFGSWAGNLVSKRGQVPPLTPLGQKLDSAILSEPKVGTGNSNDPMNTCDPLGIPRNLVFETRGLAFATMSTDRIAVLHQYQRIWRYVWMDGKHELPKKIDTKDGAPSRWYGYSIGHWDGDHTLVIDTTGSNDTSWVDKAGYPHSVNAMIEERYTRTDHNHMQAVITVDDPAIFTKSFVLSTNDYQWIPDQEAEEQICVPSEMIQYMNLISKPSFGVSGETKSK